MKQARKLRTTISALRHDATGTTVIETAIMAPVLLVMALGTFDVSQMVAHQHHLQAGASDVESIILAVASGTATDAQSIKSAVVNSLGIGASKVTIALVYRCNFQSTLQTSSSCGEGQTKATYVRATITDTYSPTWTEFGVGGDLNYRVVRTVQVS